MTGERPVWLNDEPELAALLNAVLDRFDHQAGESRQKAIVLPLARHLKSLARADTAADQSWALLQDLQNLGVLSIRQARRSTYDPEWQEAKVAFAPDAEETLRRWLGRAPAEPVMQVWRRAVAMHAHAFANSGDALAQQRIVLDGRTAQEVVAALARIGDVRGAATLRQLSAFAFWGDSKALDGRGELIAALFPRLEVRERTIVVAVFLPVVSRGVLFIENQDTYTAATRGLPADLREFVLVYASGFRSAASRIRSRTGALLHYAGEGRASSQHLFERWWFDDSAATGPCCFWGDLDFSGMQILKALRARFGDVTAWRPGYEPMLAALRTTGGYRDRSDEAAGQMDPGITGCGYADQVLLPAIREHGRIDQEQWLPGR